MKIVIIGNGISGITAARWIRKMSDHQITIISSESDYFFSRTALMYIYMGHMRLKDTQPYEPHFWKKNNIELLNLHITKIDHLTRRLFSSEGNEVTYDKLILAVGSKSNQFNWPGLDLDGVRGLYSLQDLDYIEERSSGIKRAVIVGGGLIGIELAEMFHSRKIPATLLVRESSYWNNVLPPEESQMVNEEIKRHHVDLRLGEELSTINGNSENKVVSITTKNNETIECEFVGLTVGVSPNIEFLKESDLEIEKGILVDNNLQTNLEGIFAVGDCAQLKLPQPGRRPIEAVWYTGRMMGEVAAHNVLGSDVKYNPGIWFNSAKFFNIEYQVYGYVPAKGDAKTNSVFWQNSEKNKSVRIVFSTSNTEVVGFNLMGIRFRHEVCEKWIKQKSLISEVISNLKLAFFDPEFYPTNQSDMTDTFSKQLKEEIPQASHDVNSVLEFLNR